MASQTDPRPRSAKTSAPMASFLFVSQERRRAVLDDIAQGSAPRPLYYILLAVSAGIAAFGLLGNSAAVVIGAMLVSPLMTPIFGISLSLSRGDLRLLADAALAEFGGVALIVVFAGALGFLPFALEVTPEMLARTRPTLIDLFVAMLAGLAGGFAMVDERTSPMLPGVAIATSLTPPLATSGLCLAFGAYEGAWGAFLLFFANFLAILAVSTAVFILGGFVTREELGSRSDLVKRFSATAVGLLAVAAVLTRQLVIMIDDWRTHNSIVQTLETDLARLPGASLDEVFYRTLPSSGLNVLAVIRTPRALSPQRVKHLQDSLSGRLGEPVSLFLRCAITQTVTPTGSVGLLPQVDLNGAFVDLDPSPEVRITETAEQVLRELVSTTHAFSVQDVELVSVPSGFVVVASVEGARTPAPLQVAYAQQQIRQRLGDDGVTLLVRAVTTVDVTAKGRILIGDAHFGTLDAEQTKLQSALETLGRTALQRLPDTFVSGIDAALRSDGWVVRARVNSARMPRPADIGAVERQLASAAGGPVALSVWASTDLIVTGRGYDSMDAYIEAEAVRRQAARDTPSTPDDAGAQVPGTE